MSLTQKNEIDKAGDGDGKAGNPPKQVTVTVDDVSVVTPKDTTPRALLLAAGLDPTLRRLVKVEGKHQTPYPDPDIELKVHPGERFITVSTGGTPVS